MAITPTKINSRWAFRFALVAISIPLAVAKWRQNQRTASPTEIASATQTDFHTLQDQVRSATARVMPCVVAIETAESIAASPLSTNSTVTFRSASGVIVTGDGLVLSQYHVTHRISTEPGMRDRFRRPGEMTTVALSDGRKVKAKLLGADQTFDLSLLQLMETGPYPFRPVKPSNDVGLGDWLLKLGHPLGYRADRPAVVRLGRVLYRTDDIFVTDCLMIGGDSGGPFFDLSGRLVGIIYSGDAPGGLRGSLRTHSPRSRLIGPWSSTTSKLINERIASMRQGRVVPFDQNEYDRLVHGHHRGGAEGTLPKEHWTQGQAELAELRRAVKDARRSVVAIVDEADRDAALGTIVSQDGWIVTIASTLPADFRCRLPNGTILPGRIFGVDPSYDLAIIRVSASGLEPILWDVVSHPVAGTMIAATGCSDSPSAIGVVSVTQRGVSGPFATEISRKEARPILVYGRSTADGFAVDGSGEEALESGIRPGDLIVTIAGKGVRTEQEVKDASRGYFEGQRVPVRCSTAGQIRDLTLEFTAEYKPQYDVPIFFEGDLPLATTQCGGPTVGLDGHALGLIVHRHEYGCIVIPAECVERIWPGLKSGGIANGWVKPPPTIPSSSR